MMKRKPYVQKMTIANGATTAVSADGKPLDVSQMAFGGVHVTEGLDGKTLSFVDNGEWGADVVATKVVSTGWNPFTDTESRALGPSVSLSISVTVAPSVDSSLWLKLKS